MNSIQLKSLIYISLVANILFGCKPDTKEVKVTQEPNSGNFIRNKSIFIGKDYLIDDQHSYIGFKIKYFGFSPVRGRFNTFDGTLFFDENNLQSISTTLFIDINSINTGNTTRDEDLLRENSWFDASKHPYAVFESTEVKPKQNGGFELFGNLTIKDITKPLKIDFEAPTQISRDWAKNEQVDFTGKAVINRQDFGVFGGDFWSTVMENGLTQLSDEVELELNIHCRRPDYIARYNDADSSDIGKMVLNRIKSKDIEAGITLIDSLYHIDQISSGKLSTIGYTLIEWNKMEDALIVFNKKKSLYHDSDIVFNQLAITKYLLGNVPGSISYFQKALELDSLNSRATEYLRMINDED